MLVLDGESIFNCMIKMLLALAYHFLVGCFVCRVSIFAMIINLLMGADARDNRGHQGRGDSAT